MKPLAAFLLLLPVIVHAQTAVTTRNTNLRRSPSTAKPAIRLLSAGDTVSLISTAKRNGFYHVATQGDTGWMWAKNMHVTSTKALAATTASANFLEVSGTKSFAGCGDGLWKHVYNPQRLLIHSKCVTVTGTIVDPTAHNKHPTSDHVRHEGDGDTHGWLKVDKPFESMLNAGNKSDEDGNLVFELVCHYSVSQADAKSSCVGFKDHTAIPAVGTHVEIRGTFVQDDNHAHWNEIHPVSSLKVIP